jgi:hypothetical protein
MNATDGKYVIIHDWMNKLGLSANEKIALALVYGYTIKDGVSCVKNACLEEWVGCTRKTANNTMDSLEEKGLIIRGQEIVNGKVANTYKLGEEKLQSMGVKITTIHGKNYQVRGKNLPGNMEKITPYKDINKDNINITLPTHVREKIEVIKKWLTENALGTESLAIRNQLIQGACPIEEIVKKLEPYVEQYYTEQLEQGKGEIEMRGRTDILSHFANRLPAYIRKEKDQEETKTQPIATKKNGNFDKADFLAKLNS